MTTLTTDRLILRPPEAGDLEAWMRFLLSDRAKFMRSDDVDEETAWRAFGTFIGHWTLRGWGAFIFAERSTPARPLGATGPWYPHGWPEKELSWSVWDEAAEGRGLAAEAAEAARAHAFGALGWKTAVSYIDPRNLRSIRLAERLGAKPDWTAEQLDPDEPFIAFRHPSPEALQ